MKKCQIIVLMAVHCSFGLMLQSVQYCTAVIVVVVNVVVVVVLTVAVVVAVEMMIDKRNDGSGGNR